MTTKKDQQAFAKAYGMIHFCGDLVSKMCDPDGNLKPDVTPQQVHDLKRACLEASCAAGAVRATHDGHPA